MCELLITVKIKTKTPTQTTDLSSKILSLGFFIHSGGTCMFIINLVFFIKYYIINLIYFTFIYFINSAVPTAR